MMSDKEKAKHARFRRRNGWFVLLDKETGDIVVQAKNGCFGILKGRLVQKYNDELWEEWAYGTAGSFEP